MIIQLTGAFWGEHICKFSIYEVRKLNHDLEVKYELLENLLKNYKNVIVAFSGGVDSTLLLKVSHDVLGDKVLAVTAKSCLCPTRELQETIDFCENNHIHQTMIELDPFSVDGFCHNPKNRCYLCKKYIFHQFLLIAQQNHIPFVAEGSNLDDLNDFRPGAQAISELGIISPLKEAGLTKQDIRALSRELGLKTWNKPSFACLASRFVYGEMITHEKLSMVEQAEQILSDLGFKQFRVRIHGLMARIEVLPDDIESMIKYRTEIVFKFKLLGFTYISMDLEGYRMGSMNVFI